MFLFGPSSGLVLLFAKAGLNHSAQRQSVLGVVVVVVSPGIRRLSVVIAVHLRDCR